MNLNDYPEELRSEEQWALNLLVGKMDRVIESLSSDIQGYVEEAKNADIAISPDLYLAKVLAQKGIKDTEENREAFLQSRDELYHTRLLLEYDLNGKKGVDEVKVGLHTCMNGADMFITSWKMPLCRHYILDNAALEYKNVVKDKRGMTYVTDYKLLVKNQIKLRFTHVLKAINVKRRIMGGVFCELISAFLPTRSCRVISDCTV